MNMNFNIKENLKCFDEYENIDYTLDQPNNNINKYDPFLTTYRTLFVLENILSDKECNELIQLGNTKYKPITFEFNKNIRDCKRFLSLSPIFAQTLWNRICEFIINDRCTNNTKPFGFGIGENTWIPTKINNCFRFIKYDSKSIGFKPHRDACYVENKDKRSALTIIIYLNDDFEGGDTVFYKPIVKRKKGQTVEEEMIHNPEEIFRYKPKKGSCIIFNHNMIHEGTKVDNNDKYIIRSDIIFERIGTYDGNCIYDDPDFQEAIELYREANNLETDGDVDKSGEYYERGLSYRQYKDDLNGF